MNCSTLNSRHTGWRPVAGACLLWLLCGWFTSTTGLLAAETNAPPRFPPLAEVLKKWADTPLEGVQRAAESGELTAQHYLGYCFTEGIRFAKDVPAGVTWYERAGKGGYLPSLSNLGLIYWRGRGVPPDPAKAASYFRPAAEAGMSQAQANLGFLYRDGEGLQRDPAQAMKWFTRAAEQGHPGAKVGIGRLYRFGDGVPKDAQAARKWFTQAAQAGSGLGLLNLGLLDEEMGMADQAIGSYRQAAAKDEPEAMIQLYFCLWDGVGVAQDRTEAIKWLTQAAEARNPYAECLLGYRCEQNEWVGEEPNRQLKYGDIAQALRWYRRSADQGWPGGQYHLARLYLAGTGVAQDEERGLDLIRAAADQNHPESLCDLAGLYAGGVGEPRDDKDRPCQLLLRAAARGCRDAYRPLSHRYQFGLGTERDYVEAAAWLCRAGQSDLTRWGRTDAQLFQAARLDQQADPFLVALALYLKAASQSNPAAFAKIGGMYQSGQGVPKKLGTAWCWYTLAAQHGDAGAGAKVSELESRLSAEELTEARRLLPGLEQQLKETAAAARTLGEGSQKP